MKLISKFRDYYDSALARGVDTRVVYIRTVEEKSVENIKAEPVLDAIADVLANVVSLGYGEISKDAKCEIEEVSYPKHLFFCGKHYPMVALRIEADESHLLDLGMAQPYENIYAKTRKMNAGPFYSLEQIREFLSKFNVDYDIDIRDTRMGRDMEILFQERVPEDKAQDINFHYNSPIVLVEHDDIWITPYWRGHLMENGTKRVTVNPELKPLGFQTIMDPFTTMDKVQSFIDGIMGGRSPAMVEISDKDKIHKKGFDPVMGFRKRSSKKRRRK